MEKVHIFVTFLLITFLVHFFKTFSTDLESAFFDTFFDKKKKCLVMFVLLLNFEAKRAKTAQKTENLFL